MIKKHIVRCVAVLLIFTTTLTAPARSADKKTPAKKSTKKKPAAKITYDDHVKPIFRAKCFSCHNSSKKKGGLDLTTYTNLTQGGGSGEVVDPGSSGDSYLYTLVTHESQPFMPPKSEKLAKTSLEMIRKWIDGGALENSGSKPVARKKFKLTLKSTPTGRPSGPPVMPGRLSRQPVLRTKRTAAVTALATSPWAPLTAVAGQKQVFLYQSKTLELLGVLPFPEGVPQVLKFSRNGTLLLAGGGRGGASGRVVVWDVKTGRRVIVVGDEFDIVLAADISADQRLIALGGPNRIVRIYSTETGKLKHEIKKHTDWITAIEFSPDGVLLATGDRNGGLFVWESDNAREYLSLKGHRGAINAVTWRGDSNILASASADASIKLWEMENGRQVKSWGAHGGGTASVEFTRDGRLVSCGRDRRVKIWNQNGKAQRSLPPFADLALRVTHCDESNRVIAGDWTGIVRVWDAANGKPVGVFSTNPLSIQQRLQKLRKTLPSLQTKQKSLVAAAAQAEKAVAAIQTNLTATKRTLADAQKLIRTTGLLLKSLAQKLAQSTVDIAKTTKLVTTRTAVAAPLAEAVSKAQLALSKNPTDKELARVIAQLKTQFDKNSAALSAAKKSLAGLQTQETAVRKQQTVSLKQLSDAGIRTAAAQKQIPALTKALKPAAVNAAKTKATAAAASATVSQTQNRIAKLESDLKIEAALLRLRKEEATSTALAVKVATAERFFQTGKTAYTAAQAKSLGLKNQTTSTTRERDTIQASLNQESKAKTSLEKTVRTLTEALPLLKKSITKSQAAAVAVKGDKSLQNAVKVLQSALKRNSARLTAAKKGQTEKTSAVGKLQQQLAAVTKRLTAITSQWQAAEKKAAAAKRSLDAARTSAAAAKIAALSARDRLTKTKAEIQSGNRTQVSRPRK